MAYQDDRITAIPAPLPKDYDRGFSFTDYQTLNPDDPMPGPKLDNEFANIEQALDETQARLRLIQRDDGAFREDFLVPYIEDSLVSADTEKALSANQGRVLNNKIGLLEPSSDPEAKNKVTSLSDITSLASLDTSELLDGQQFSVGSYLPDTSTGSCLIRWRPDLPKSRHDGVLFFSLTVPMFTGTDTADYRNGVGETDLSGDGVMELVRGEIIYDATASIPSHYDDLQSGIDSLSARISPKMGARVVLRIESEYEIDTVTVIADGDYRHFYIESQDETVPVVLNSSQVDEIEIYGKTTRKAAITCLNCVSPIFEISMNGSDVTGVLAGVYGLNSQIMFSGEGNGAVNFSDDNIFVVDTSQFIATRGVFTGAGRNGISVLNESSAALEFADVGGAEEIGLRVTNRSSGNIENGFSENCGTGVSANDASVINARSLTASGCNEAVVSNVGCIVNARNITANNCGNFGLNALYGAIVADDFSEVNNCSGSAIRAIGPGAIIYAQNISADDSTGNAVDASRGATINVDDGSFQDCLSIALYANSATINGRDVVATGASSHGASAESGATMRIEGADVSGAGGWGINCNSSFVNARDVDASDGGDGDIRWLNGGTLTVTGATGTLIDTANDVSSRGVAYQ